MITNMENHEVIGRVRDFCDNVGSELSSLVSATLIKSPLEIKTIKMDPDGYSTAVDFAKDYACLSALKKFEGLPGTTSSTRKAAALSSWSSAEEMCLKTNQRVLNVFHGSNSLLNVPLGSGEEANVTIAAVILTAQRKIENVLGPFDYYQATKECRWSSGATADLPRGTQLSTKMTEGLTVTRRAWVHAFPLIASDHQWVRELVGGVDNIRAAIDKQVNFIDYTRFVNVPKNAFTDRGISAEPTLNAFLQQGMGRYIRRRLKSKACIDLDYQSFNQWLAGKAGTLGYSTIDLESASDTLSYQLVKLLVPETWFNYLDDLRTPCVSFEGKKLVKVQKFSAMGNAYTFELESLVFWAISSAVNELSKNGGSVAVFGDDIIVKREISLQVIDALQWCGFKVNTEKTFLTGRFFESCGAHYFDGELVTPFYQKKAITALPEVIRFHNRLLRWSIRINGSPFSKETKAATAGLITRGSPLIPMSETGDDGFLVTRSVLAKEYRYCPNHGYRCRVLSFRPSKTVGYREGAFYANKLRHSSFLNADPKGRCLVASDAGRWIHQERWIHCYGD